MSRPTHAMHRFANPARFLRLSAALRPWALGVALLTPVAGLWLALFDSPPDYQLGETVRIMYIHVPSAWMATVVYATIAVASAVGLVWKHPVAERSEEHTSELQSLMRIRYAVFCMKKNTK